ncbi:uncharacterized protein LOC142587163 [Dermacentor variabilis]|uniref:uncharacterized protein LOC142587163 n=1 Tax=Dermacentor variabilis TaxID=34621 RepID=UPI003F5AF2DB
MKPSSSVLVLLVSLTYVHDMTLAGFFSFGKKKTPASCSKPPYLGRCERTNRGWYFDPTVGWCKMFNYGPCGGGLNNFQSEMQCLEYCLQKRQPKTVCSLPPKTRQCWGSSRHWYFDPTTNSCKMLQGKLCADNANGFSTCAKCLYRCSSTKPETICPRSSMQGQNTLWLPGQRTPQEAPILNTQPIWPTQQGHSESTSWLPGRQNSQATRMPSTQPIWPTQQGHSESASWLPGRQNSQGTRMPSTQPIWPPHQSHSGNNWFPGWQSSQGTSIPNPQPTWYPPHGRSENSHLFPGGENPKETRNNNRQPSLPPDQGRSKNYNTSMYAFLN